MPKFSDVFSITWKVLLALFLISLGLTVAYYVIGAIGGTVARSGDSGYKDTYIRTKAICDKDADEKHTIMPQSKWDKLIAAAIKQHCPVEGMTLEQAESAFGKPNNSKHTGDVAGNGETWQYERTVQGKCLKYKGEDCAEYETKHETVILYFSPNGHLTYPFQDGGLGTNCMEEPFYSSYYPLLH